MDHLYHGYVNHNQRVIGMVIPGSRWAMARAPVGTFKRNTPLDPMAAMGQEVQIRTGVKNSLE